MSDYYNIFFSSIFSESVCWRLRRFFTWWYVICRVYFFFYCSSVIRFPNRFSFNLHATVINNKLLDLIFFFCYSVDRSLDAYIIYNKSIKIYRNVWLQFRRMPWFARDINIAFFSRPIWLHWERSNVYSQPIRLVFMCIFHPDSVGYVISLTNECALFCLPPIP